MAAIEGPVDLSVIGGTVYNFGLSGMELHVDKLEVGEDFIPMCSSISRLHDAVSGGGYEDERILRVLQQPVEVFLVLQEIRKVGGVPGVTVVCGLQDAYT